MTRPRALLAALVTVLFLGGLGVGVAVAAGSRGHESSLGRDLRTIDRSATWTNVSKLKLAFPRYHPEGLVVTKHRYYLSSTQIITPTVPYAKPRHGYDRTPGRASGICS